MGLLIDMKKREPGEPGSATVTGSRDVQRASAGPRRSVDARRVER
ncbi:hypothetical protein BURCENBC7_AP4274 [Burkholderia cenocepacia BC7]|nr:hypothetical protein BURCENK562V_C5123 [Burkholderia cenocepacia K56-2Valvano]ERI24876.1 hypothetical protein BURCENBC7_AP4274 [Burkholderia cenocepacia BC7]WJN72645.1 hypothetical protein OH687_20290 [Burkholderia anthina]